MIGGSQAEDATLALAEEVGRLLAEAGARVVCGGLGGVMESVARGATGAGGEVIGIVPGDDPAEANEHVTHPIATGSGLARNLAVVATAVTASGTFCAPLVFPRPCLSRLASSALDDLADLDAVDDSGVVRSR